MLNKKPAVGVTVGGHSARNSSKTLETVPISNSRPVIVCIDSDTHFGSVLSPVLKFEKKNGQVEHPTKRQSYLADERRRFVDDMAGLKSKLNAFLLYVNLGDVTEGVKHKSAQRISEDIEDHVKLAQMFMKPISEVADLMVCIRGTEAHDGIGATLAEATFRPAAEKVWKFDEESGALTGYRAFIDVGGVRFDLEHHISGASRGRRAATSNGGQCLHGSKHRSPANVQRTTSFAATPTSPTTPATTNHSRVALFVERGRTPATHSRIASPANSAHNWAPNT